MKSANQVHKLPQRLGKSIIYAMEKSPARWANMIVYICMPAISKTVPLSVAWAILFFAVVAADPCFCYAFSMFLDLRFVAFYLHFRVCSPHHPWFVFPAAADNFVIFQSLPHACLLSDVLRCVCCCRLRRRIFYSLSLFVHRRHRRRDFPLPSLPGMVIHPCGLLFFFTKLTMSQSRHKPNATTKSKKKRLIQNTTK